jgi:phosphoribosyl-ATP pyrophosphohydrolase
MLRSKTENRHLLDTKDPAYLTDDQEEERVVLERLKKKPKPKYGYHTVKIKKGVLGEISKIQEEVDELKDAEKQGARIMIMCELADIYGAVRVYARKYNLKMRDLHLMSKLTRNAFEQGHRK